MGHGKEGVVGASPSEGSENAPQYSRFVIRIASAFRTECGHKLRESARSGVPRSARSGRHTDARTRS